MIVDRASLVPLTDVRTPAEHARALLARAASYQVEARRLARRARRVPRLRTVVLHGDVVERIDVVDEARAAAAAALGVVTFAIAELTEAALARGTS